MQSKRKNNVIIKSAIGTSGAAIALLKILLLNIIIIRDKNNG